MKNLTFLLLVIVIFISCKKEPDAIFQISGSQKVGVTILFKNLSSHATTYSWDFGDLTTSTLATPTHTYPKPGKYIVSLTAKGEGGASSTDQTLNITGTTYSFRNTSRRDLPQFCTFYLTESYLQDFVEHGILKIGGESDIVITTRSSIQAGFIENNVGYILPETFKLVSGQHNTLMITDQTLGLKILADGKTNDLIKKYLQKH